MNKATMDPWKSQILFRPPETPHEPMEFLSRSWSNSALEVSKAIAPPPFLSKTNIHHVIDEDIAGEEETTEESKNTADSPTNPFTFPSSETCRMMMDRIMSQSQEVSPRMSHSNGTHSGGSDSPPPVSPSKNEDLKQFNKVLNNHRVVAASTTTGSSSKTMGRWLKDRKEKKKEETRIQIAQLHAAVSVAGVAAAVAAIAAATAAAAASGSRKDEVMGKMDMAVASAATLVAAQCVETAEAMGADREQLTSVVSSAVNVRNAGDIMTLTAAAATALRGAATLKARALKDVYSVVPVEKTTVGGVDVLKNFGLTNDKLLKNGSNVEENLLGDYSREVLARGFELLKRTRKGDLHWKIVSVYIKMNKVKLKMKSRHVGGTFTKKKKNIVVDVIRNMPAWPGRRLVEGGQNMRYFGLKTEMRGVIEFECRNQKEHDMLTQGISKLVDITSQNRSISTTRRRI